MEKDNELTRALWSLKEDATFAWKESLGGGVPNLYNVGRAYELVKQAAMRLDAEEKVAPV